MSSCNIVCLKWGSKYSSDYVNILYNMVRRNIDQEFKFFCYTDDPTGIIDGINIIDIKSGLEKWWPKLDLLSIFTEGETIFFDLDIVILNNLSCLISLKTKNLTILYSFWKNNAQTLRSSSTPTLFNSSVMKWTDAQGVKVYKHFMEQKHKYLLIYSGVDRFFYNEPVTIDLLPSNIAYSYWKGAMFHRDNEPELLRLNYDICILNHGDKNKDVIDKSWIKDYWK